MSKVDDAAADVAAKVTALEAQVAANGQVLAELKALADSANADNAVAVLGQVSARIEAVTSGLKASDDQVDPTPAAPADGSAQ